MAAFLTGLANWGSGMGQGYVAGKEEQARLAQQQSEAQQRALEMQVTQGRLELERQRLEQEKWMKLTPGELLWNPKTGEFKRPELPDENAQALESVNRMESTLTDPQDRAAFRNDFQANLESSYGDVRKALTASSTLYREMYAKQQTQQQKSAEATRETTALRAGPLAGSLAGANAKDQGTAQQIFDAYAAVGKPEDGLKAAQAFLKDQRDTAERERQQLAMRKESERFSEQEGLNNKMMMVYFAAMAKPGAQEFQRAEMAQNVNENLNKLDDILKRRPELFGPLFAWPPAAGLRTQLRIRFGSSDPDVTQLAQLQDNLGRALQGAHGMRGGLTLEAAIQGVLNGFKNGADATLAASQTARDSVATFANDVADKLGFGADFLQQRGMTVPRPKTEQPKITPQTNQTQPPPATGSVKDRLINKYKPGGTGSTAAAPPASSAAQPKPEAAPPPAKPSAGIRSVLDRGGHYVGEIVDYQGRRLRVRTVNAKGDVTGTEAP
jgi:hypothetical protein